MILSILVMAGLICIALLDITRPRGPATSATRAQGTTRPAPMRTFASSMQGDLLPADDSDRYGLAPIYRMPSAAPAPSYILETQAPHSTPSVETGFVLPALQTFGTAVALTLAVGVLAWVFGWAVKVVGIAFALAMAGGWFWRLGLADRLLWKLETWTKQDLDGSGGIGRPAASFAVVNPAVARATSARSQRDTEQDERQAELLTFLDKCYLLGTSESSHGIKATGPDRERFTACRDVLMGLGLAEWKNPERPKSGWVLTTDPATAKGIAENHVL